MIEQKSEIEQILLKFRPASPPESLRARMLSAANLTPTYARTWGGWAFWLTVAAMLIFACGLNFAAEATTNDIVDSIGLGPAIWTKDAEEVARMLDGNGWGRQYIALGLMAETGPVGPLAQPAKIPGAI